MNDTRRIAGLVLLILLASLIQWPTGRAITPQDQTISITDTHDDLFITETGIGIDSQLCHILDPNMDIRSFLVFRELEINWWEPLENATLRFRTTSTLDFDADSSVTVYGMRYSDLQLEGWLNPGWVLSVPLTSASVSVNTSQLYGQTWHEVNVTTIVEELIRSYEWDGDGADGTETGDAIGFIIYGAEGYDTRWFIDYLYGTPSLAPQLVIHWNHEVSPPAGYEDAIFNSTLGGYHIWELIPKWMNYTDWVEYDADSRLSVVNSSYVAISNLDAIDEASLNNDTRGPYLTGSWKFGAMISDVTDNMVASKRPIAFFHGLGNPDLLSGLKDYEPVHAIAVGISDYDDGTDDRFYFAIESHGEGASSILYSDSWYEANSTRWYWFNVNYDAASEDYIVQIYNDYEMTDLEVTLNRTDHSRILETGYAWEFATISLNFDTYNAKMSGALKSIQGPSTWLVTDENGTVMVDDCETLDCAVDWIDTYDPDPEDPDPGDDWSTGPGGETGAFTRFRMRLWFLLIGFGCMFGPILFFAWRRPSGYYLGAGFILMLIGLGMLLAIGQV